MQLQRGAARHASTAARWPTCATRTASSSVRRSAIAWFTRAWDLGVGDDTSIWWFQAQGAQLVMLDHYAAAASALSTTSTRSSSASSKYGWMRGIDYVPHDAKVKEWGSRAERASRPCQRLASSLSLCRWQPSTTALTPSDERCLYACFIRAVRTVASARSNNTDASGTTKRSASSRSRCTTGRRNPADAFRYLAQAWRPAPRLVPKSPIVRGWHIPPPNENRRGGIRL